MKKSSHASDFLIQINLDYVANDERRKKEDRNQNRIPLMCFINKSQKGPGGYITTLIRVLMWSDETMMTMMRRLLALKLFEIRRHRFIRVLIELGERRMLP